ncbi:zinc finger protein 2-like [Polypterus senegalus]|uniref:zinc finger protein 2-like n=1 Tax=Polypterus senegalus TaxID=55291 RepID=UPI00196684C5|nr:zinc finger protein 2-like [Polypterus senegalus]XP_039608370.1 zinc finger protein 2-like [Polypterus senegalus]XP_039608371.1 zinc finger protein 2-like [Polypterus senegalus]
MASVKQEGTDQRLAHIKEEDCESGAPEGVCVKVEDCEESISVFKEEECKEESSEVKVEDLKDFSFGLALQKREAGPIFKRDVCEESLNNLQPWVTNTGQLATVEISVQVKSELSEREEKITEGDGRKAEEQLGKNLHEKGSIFTSSFAQTSILDCEKMKKPTSGSENLTPASSQCSSRHATTITQTKALTTCQLEVSKHIQVQTREKLYYCLECGKRFLHKNSLSKHKKLHTGEKLYSCAECNKCFLERGNLNIHMIVHSGEKPHCCSECGKRFLQISSLRIHTRIHTGEKPYCCLECGKRFYDSSGLRDHSRTHTGEKSYVCSECGKRLSNSSSFRKHKRTHTGEKPYICSKCGKSFSGNGALFNHAKIHAGETPECDQQVSASNDLHVLEGTS